MPYKLVVIVRQDLRLPPGKLAVQVAHASVECVLKSDRRLVDEWRKGGGKKVVLKVGGKRELLKFRELAEDAGLKNSLITDAGRTTVEPGTVTCLGIGPADEYEMDSLTSALKMR